MSVSNISVDVRYVFLSTGVSRINTFNADWYVITSNSTCQYLAAANNFNIHISSNYGGTWNQTTIPDNITFSGITIDSSGKYMAACSGSNGIIYISNNYGTSWSQITNTQIPFIASRYGWNSITSDSTGKYLVVCGINYSSGGNYSNGAIYKSSDYGTTWSSGAITSAQCLSITSDSTGQYLAVVTKWSTIGQIYNSSNYGSTWNITTASQANWIKIKSDSTGNYLVANTSNSIFKSSNRGATWTTTGLNITDIFEVASNSTGQYLAAAILNIGFYTSSDYGTSWFLNINSTLRWSSITSDSTGQYLVACSEKSSGIGGIYTPSILRYRKVPKAFETIIQPIQTTAAANAGFTIYSSQLLRILCSPKWFRPIHIFISKLR